MSAAPGKAPRQIFITFHAMSRAKTRRVADRKRADDADAQREWSDRSLSRWLRERASAAIDHGERLPSGRRSARILHDGIVFVFNPRLDALKTVFLPDSFQKYVRSFSAEERRNYGRVLRRTRGKRTKAEPRSGKPPRRVDAGNEEYLERYAPEARGSAA